MSVKEQFVQQWSLSDTQPSCQLLPQLANIIIHLLWKTPLQNYRASVSCSGYNGQFICTLCQIVLREVHKRHLSEPFYTFSDDYTFVLLFSVIF